MPSAITHELIAASAKELVPKRIREIVGRAPDYYYLGAQGPDLFFFYRPLKRGNFGKLLHRERLYEWFTALLDAIPAQEERDKALSYALGFCGHLEGDAAFHPFVYAYLADGNLSKREHQRIENDWDVWFLATVREKEVFGYSFPFDLKKIARSGTLWTYLNDAAGRMGVKLKRGAFKRCLRLFSLYLRHFHRRRGRILKPFFPTFYPNETPDRGVLGGERFLSLSGNKGKDAEELFLLAAKNSAQRMEEFFSCFESGAPLPPSFSRHLLTGEPL